MKALILIFLAALNTAPIIAYAEELPPSIQQCQTDYDCLEAALELCDRGHEYWCQVVEEERQ